MRSRFAPSPSGPLHVGHLHAALEARRLADKLGGDCLLRIEDIDARCKPEWYELMMQDISWLGLRFDGEHMHQSKRFDIYASALDNLRAQGLLYPCFCTRTQMKQQMDESGRAPHESLGYQYEGHCRELHPDEVARRLAAAESHAWRLDMRAAEDLYGKLSWYDSLRGEQHSIPSSYGDPVLARKEFPASYHLCVVVDDAEQGVSHITRGVDLFASTHIHRVLQAALSLATPLYHHHGLLLDNQGKRLAKRDGARSIASLRESGYSPRAVKNSLQVALESGGIWQI